MHREQSINPKFDVLLNDLLTNCDRILSAFASHPATVSQTQKWAHSHAKDIYLEEVSRMSSKKSGFHFGASGASAQQIFGFDASTLVPRVAAEVPFLWDLNRSLLHKSHERKGFVDLDSDKNVDAQDVVCIL